MDKVIVRVPASTSNLGPGFDCLGVALRIYNTVKIARADRKQRLPRIVDEAARLFFKHSRKRAFAFSCEISGNVPQSRGLGSSVTVRLGVLHGLNELCERPLDRLSIFHLCAELEGHPDNAAPASFGGFAVAKSGASVSLASGKRDARPTFQRFEVSPRLYFVLLIPDFEIKTPASRKVLPSKISRKAAVESCGKACAITAAFASRQYENLRGAFADQLHQPFRTKLIPFLPRVILAAEKAGAFGAFLSGSGSTICAITLQDRHRVAAAMQRGRSTSTRVVITTADNHGVQIHGT
ncbi:MAG: homoserine kinase [Spartobacteria bacterium]